MNQLERPTSVRHIVIAAAFLMSVLLYLHRFCISVAQTYIQEDLNLTDQQVGMMLSAFFWTYALGQVPAGWLTDRFGSRIMLTSYILLWSLFTGLTGAASAFAAVLLLRFGFGFAQAGAYPTAASIVSKWVPFQSRGSASGIISMGGRVGAVLAMFATGYLLVWFTPASTPPTLDSNSIMNGERLCYELAIERPADSPTISLLRDNCFEQFTTSGQTLVQAFADNYARALEAKQEGLAATGKSTKDAAPDVRPFPQSEVPALLEEINGVIQARSFFEPDDLKDIKVENEARRLARRGAELTETETHRMNRLVLEGLHRQSIKKLYVAGWRPLMFLYGSLGLIVAAVIWWTCHKSPASHPKCNSAEAELIAGDSQSLPQTEGKVSGVPLLPLIKSVSMWLCCLTQWFTNIGWAFLMLLAPRYFTNEHQLSIETVGLLSAIPPIAGGLGMFSGGTVTDRLVRVVGLRWGRVLPITVSRFIAMGAYIVCLFDPSPTIAVVMFACVAFFTGIGTPAMWAFNQDVGGRFVGSVLGWGNMWGNFGAAVTPPLLLWVVGSPERWEYVFATCAAAFFLSGIVALGINATIPIVRDDEEVIEAATAD
ncbi:MAG: MFS transporter [Planctomycetes bacterium]|nr:MFS transporter [Planctomycetota bacterium]